MKLVTLAIVKNGKPDHTPTNAAKIRQFFKDNEGKKIRMEYALAVDKTRTLSQNAYYWVYLDIIEQETGNLSADLHEFFKLKLLPPKYITVKGKSEHTFKTCKSTTELTKQEFGDLLDKICAMTNVALPDPEAAGYLPN